MPLRSFLIDVSPLRENPDFRYIFIARTISLFGIGFLAVALPLQVFRLTGSSVGVASVSGVLAVAVFTGTIGGGVLADRYDRRKIISLARTGAGIAFAALAVNAMLPDPYLWLIYVCAVVDGLCGGVSSTALVSVTPSLVPKEKLPAAAALMSLTTEIGSVAAPSLGGLTVAVLGVHANYLVATAATVATTIWILKLPALPPTVTRRESVAQAVATGARFAFSNRLVGGLLLAGMLAVLLGGVTVLLPEFVERVLHGGPTTLGILHSSIAVGALLGSVTSGWTSKVRRGGAVVLAGILLAAGGLLGAGTTGLLAFTVLGLVAHGWGRAIGDILRFAMIQQNTPAELRGRVASLWQAQMSTGVALGAMVAGSLAAIVSVRWAITTYGALGLLGVVILTFAAPALRRARMSASETTSASAK